MNGHLRKNLMQQRAKVISALRTDPELSSRFARSVDEAMGAFDAWQFANSINADLQNAFTSAAFSQLDLEASFGEIVSDDAIEFQENRLPQIAEKRAEDRLGVIDGIGNQISAKLNQQILEGYDNGENLTQVTDRVRKVFNVGLSRARTIARTEATIMTVGGAQAQADANGMKFKKWIAHEDEFTRESHSQAQREGWIPAEEPFKATGSMRPGDGSAAEVVNCRCALRWSNKNRNKPAEDKPQKGTETKAKDAVAEPPATSKKKPWDDPDLYNDENVSDEEFMKIKMDGILREINGEGHGGESLQDKLKKVSRESKAEHDAFLVKLEAEKVLVYEASEAVSRLYDQREALTDENEKRLNDLIAKGASNEEINAANSKLISDMDDFKERIYLAHNTKDDLQIKVSHMAMEANEVESRIAKRQREVLIETFGNAKAKPLLFTDDEDQPKELRSSAGRAVFGESSDFMSKMYGDKYRNIVEETKTYFAEKGADGFDDGRAYHRQDLKAVFMPEYAVQKIIDAQSDKRSISELSVALELAIEKKQKELDKFMKDREGDSDQQLAKDEFVALKKSLTDDVDLIERAFRAKQTHGEGQKQFNRTNSTYLHELSHAVESESSRKGGHRFHEIMSKSPLYKGKEGDLRRPTMVERSFAFQDKRQLEAFGLDENGKMRPAELLSKLTGQNYGDDESALEDSWTDKGYILYAGKRYESAEAGGRFGRQDFKGQATEFHTVGVERLFNDPAKFLEDDEEGFALIVGNMRGDFDA